MKTPEVRQDPVERMKAENIEMRKRIDRIGRQAKFMRDCGSMVCRVCCDALEDIQKQVSQKESGDDR